MRGGVVFVDVARDGLLVALEHVVVPVNAEYRHVSQNSAT